MCAGEHAAIMHASALPVGASTVGASRTRTAFSKLLSLRENRFECVTPSEGVRKFWLLLASDLLHESVEAFGIRILCAVQQTPRAETCGVHA